jgi:hypothetical protein
MADLEDKEAARLQRETDAEQEAYRTAYVKLKDEKAKDREIEEADRLADKLELAKPSKLILSRSTCVARAWGGTVTMATTFLDLASAKSADTKCSTEELLKEGAQLILSNTDHMTKADKDEAALKVLRPQIAARGATGLATITNCIEQARASLVTESPVLRDLAIDPGTQEEAELFLQESGTAIDVVAATIPGLTTLIGTDPADVTSTATTDATANVDLTMDTPVSPDSTAVDATATADTTTAATKADQTAPTVNDGTATLAATGTDEAADTAATTATPTGTDEMTDTEAPPANTDETPTASVTPVEGTKTLD